MKGSTYIARKKPSGNLDGLLRSDTALMKVVGETHGTMLRALVNLYGMESTPNAAKIKKAQSVDAQHLRLYQKLQKELATIKTASQGDTEHKRLVELAKRVHVVVQRDLQELGCMSRELATLLFTRVDEAIQREQSLAGKAIDIHSMIIRRVAETGRRRRVA